MKDQWGMLKLSNNNKKEKFFSLSTRMMVLIATMVVIVIAALLVTNFYQTQNVMYSSYEQQANNGTDLLAYVLRGVDDLTQEDRTVTLDSLKESLDMEFTIFEGDTRVFTTIEIDGQRAVGTTLDANIADIVLKEGKTYIGSANILGQEHLASYAPFKNSSGEIIGILFAGVSISDVLPTLITSGLYVLFIAIALLIAALLFSRMYIKKYVTKRLANVVNAAQSTADGNLQFSLKKTSNDEIGKLADSFLEMQTNLTEMNNDMVDMLANMAKGNWSVKVQDTSIYKGDWQTLCVSIDKMVASVSGALNQVAVSSSQISAGSQQVSQGAQRLASGAMEQSSGIEHLSSSISDISGNVKLNFESAQKASQLATQSEEVTEITLADMELMKKAMHDISGTSQNIANIIKVIDDIAFQTNILALNAAVEAARAGSAGSGFAVVADEVRNLAQRSADAAQNTTQLIEQSVAMVNSGVDIATKTSESFEDLAQKVQSMITVISDISAACKEQSESIEKTTGEIEQISSIVHTNSATSEESAAASEELSSQANLLQSLMDDFKF